MYNSNIYTRIMQEKELKSRDFCEKYKKFVSKAKTERLAIEEIEKIIIENGFKTIDFYSSLKLGDKVYFKNRNKNIILYKIGEKDILEGLKILGSHVDSPRMDLKPNPLFEKNEFALLDTRYYGGIKKYQYVTTPLAIHGVVCKKDGTVINVNVGEEGGDPIFGISDLLIHLSGEQMQKSIERAIEGEKLDVIVGSVPIDKETEKECVKANIIRLIKEKYNIEEEDLISSEIELVPAGEARDFGFDRSMISAYGQDDRVCAYTSLMALLDSDDSVNTQCCLFVDKEEIGSVGATGADSVFFENTILELLHKEGKDTLYNLRKVFESSFMLSCDVGAALDPLYDNVSDKNNSARFNRGVLIEKYTGGRGKSNSSDANPEFIASLCNIFDKNNIHYQTGELGLVDKGGGGTIACKFAKYNLNIVDVGVPILNMHSPMEIAAKADIYETYLANKVFLQTKI